MLISMHHNTRARLSLYNSLTTIHQKYAYCIIIQLFAYTVEHYATCCIFHKQLTSDNILETYRTHIWYWQWKSNEAYRQPPSWIFVKNIFPEYLKSQVKILHAA